MILRSGAVTSLALLHRMISGALDCRYLAVMAASSSARRLPESDLDRLHDDLQAEYAKLTEIVSAFDQRLLTIKGWGVTLGLASLGLDFQQEHYGLFLVAAVSGLAFGYWRRRRSCTRSATTRGWEILSSSPTSSLLSRHRAVQRPRRSSTGVGTPPHRGSVGWTARVTPISPNHGRYTSRVASCDRGHSPTSRFPIS